MRDIIVTGGNGFIGKHLVSELKLRYPKSMIFSPNSKELDLTDYKQTSNYFLNISKSNEVSHLFHLAALYKAGGWPVHHPATQLFVNTAINNNFFEAAKNSFRNARISSVVSYCIYPDHDKPHPEEEIQNTEPEDYLFAYAFTKKGILIANRAYNQEFGMSLCSCALPTVFGPGDSISEDSHVMGALIGKFLRAKLYNYKSVEIWGDGSQEREFIFVHDVVSGIIESSLKSKSLFLNLGTNKSHTIKYIAETIRTYLKYDGEIIYNQSKFTGAKKRVMNSNKIVRELGWHPNFTLEQGIKDTIEYYLTNKDLIDQFKQG